MKKISCILSALFCLSLLFASSCGGGKTSESDHSGGVSSEEETYEQKKLSGIDPVFSESQGYYNESPSVFEAASGERYLYYTRNTVKNDDATDSIAVRKATYTANGWTYGDAKTLLVPSESGWDSKSVFGADVVRGSFSYRGTGYSYLMAYSGSDEKNRANAEIGLAVSKTPDGEWVKVGSSPVVTFDAGHYDPMGILSYRGAIEPSLVSFDKGGKVYLFYTYYTPTTNISTAVMCWKWTRATSIIPSSAAESSSPCRVYRIWALPILSYIAAISCSTKRTIP